MDSNLRTFGKANEIRFNKEAEEDLYPKWTKRLWGQQKWTESLNAKLSTTTDSNFDLLYIFFSHPPTLLG